MTEIQKLPSANKYRHIVCAVFLILDIISIWLGLWHENGFLAILITMFGIAYLIFEITLPKTDNIKIISVIFVAISVIITAIIGYYAKFGTGFNRPFVPTQLLLGFTFPTILLALFFSYVALQRSDIIKLKWTIPLAVYPTLLTSLPSYLFSAWEVSGYSAPFKCSIFVVIISLIIACVFFFISLKQSTTTAWLATISAFIWGICNILVLLYILFFHDTTTAILEFINKIPKNAILYCIIAGIVLIIFTILHTYVYLKNGVSRKMAALIITLIIIPIITFIYFKYFNSSSKNLIHNSTNKEQNNTISSSEINSSPDNNISPDFKDTQEKIDNEYNKNPIAANRKYKNKRIKIYGDVRDIGYDYKGRPYLRLSNGKDISDIHLLFDEKSTDNLSKLWKGQSITVTCTGNNEYSMKDCLINN